MMWLETVWFAVWVVLWGIYFILDGFDLGSAVLMPLVARNEKERGKVFQAIAPFWDGNEVWLITAGGVTFAAIPGAYAVLFTTFYLPLMAVLIGLIVRGSVIALRGEFDSKVYRLLCDALFFLSSLVPPLGFGVLVGNLWVGIPIDANWDWSGSYLAYFRVTPLLIGVAFLGIIVAHGANWLALKADGAVAERAAKLTKVLWIWPAAMVIYLAVAEGLFSHMIATRPVMMILPVLAVVGLVAQPITALKRRFLAGWWLSALAVFACLGFFFADMYPGIIPSSLGEGLGVEVGDPAVFASKYTLTFMLVVAGIFVPIVIAYQAWVYLLFRGETEEA
jgi:cytochrome bd ubiquinol oxidase subunit II